jgi:hypothetical protein
MLRKRYNDHKASAKQRGIPFLLIYRQWLSIWKASGHLDEVAFTRVSTSWPATATVALMRSAM